MKKKFVAGLCAFALALAMPMAALADDNSPEWNDKTVDGDTTTFENLGDRFMDGQWNYDTEEYDEWVILEKVVVEGAKDVSIDNVDWSNAAEKYGEDKLKKYEQKLQQVSQDKGTELFQFEINGEVTADDHAVVTFYLNADKYGNKVISYYILHENGDIQEKVVRVNADGTVTIWMESFSIITFMDVDGITKYENMVQPQDGELLSPKTGIC